MYVYKYKYINGKMNGIPYKYVQMYVSSTKSVCVF